MVVDAGNTPSVNPYAQVGEHPRLDELLDFWASWMRAGGAEELHCKAASFWASSADFDSMVQHADTNDATVTNAAIEDLAPIERIALHHVHLAAVWRSNREPMDVVYRRARLTLSEGLKRRQVG